MTLALAAAFLLISALEVPAASAVWAGCSAFPFVGVPPWGWGIGKVSHVTGNKNTSFNVTVERSAFANFSRLESAFAFSFPPLLDKTAMYHPCSAKILTFRILISHAEEIIIRCFVVFLLPR